MKLFKDFINEKLEEPKRLYKFLEDDFNFTFLNSPKDASGEFKKLAEKYPSSIFYYIIDPGKYSRDMIIIRITPQLKWIVYGQNTNNTFNEIQYGNFPADLKRYLNNY